MPGQGDFSQYLAASSQNTIYDPTTGNADGTGRTPFPGNRIPTGRLSQQALNILQYFPLPNLNPSNPLLPNYAASGGASFDANKWDTRIDDFLNEKTTIFGRYSNHQFERGAVGAFGSLAGGPSFNGVSFSGNSFVRNQSIAFGTTHTFSPTLVNEFRFGWMKYHVQTTPNGVGTSPAQQAGIPGLNLDNFYTSGLPYFAFNDNNNNPLTNLGYALGNGSFNGPQCNCPLTEKRGNISSLTIFPRSSGITASNLVLISVMPRIFVFPATNTEQAS